MDDGICARTLIDIYNNMQETSFSTLVTVMDDGICARTLIDIYNNMQETLSVPWSQSWMMVSVPEHSLISAITCKKL